MVAFELSSGSFAVSGIAIQSSQIIVEPSEPVKMSAQAAAPPNALGHPQDKNTPPSIANPLDAPIGFPLLGAYRYIRTYGLQRSIASQAFVDEQEEVERLLTKADSLLRPLAITRVDLERLLDAKVGISRPR